MEIYTPQATTTKNSKNAAAQLKIPKMEIYTPQAATPQNSKNAAAQLKIPKMEISTPQATTHQNAKNASFSTPQNKTPTTLQQKSAQKDKTPQQQQKNTPKSAKNSAKKKRAAMAKTPQKEKFTEKKEVDEEEDSDVEDEDDEDDNVAQPTNKKMKMSPLVKENKSSRKAQQPKGKAQKQTPIKNTADHDSRTLFIKNLPVSCSVKEIKALSGDIKLVRLRINVNKFNQKKGGLGYAYVEFASEEIAEKNFPVLAAASIKGNKLSVDYVGPKSAFKIKKAKSEAGTEEIDPLKLYIAGVHSDATESDLRKIFPKAQEVIVPMKKKEKKAFGYAFIKFATAQLAKEYHDKTQEASLMGMTLVVLYARKKPEPKKKRKKKAEKKTKKEVKKTEPEKMEADDDDEEEADDHEEEEDNEEDDDEAVDDEEEDDDDDEDNNE